ncbi:MAG: peptidylprolyl isomerase [Clostridia bacterium]|nr:peptidylprolyl isomerase [Clostridia bacterium]
MSKNKKIILIVSIIVGIFIIGGIIGFFVISNIKDNQDKNKSTNENNIVAENETTIAENNTENNNENNNIGSEEVSAQNPVATMEVEYVDKSGNTKNGTIKIELYKNSAPNTVKNFIKLANNGFYNGLTFHRVVNDFMIQGGDSAGNGTGSAKISDLNKSVKPNSEQDYQYSIKGEFSINNFENDLKFDQGVIGMARSDFSAYGFPEQGYNSGSSQFFIVNTTNRDIMDVLNGYYTAFGKVIEGYEHVEGISNIKTKTSTSTGENSEPVNAPIIKSVTVETYGVDYGSPEVINYEEVMNEIYSKLYSSYTN